MVVEKIFLSNSSVLEIEKGVYLSKSWKTASYKAVA